MKRLFLFMLLLLLFPAVVSAQNASLQVAQDKAVLEFPNSITYSAKFTSDAEISSVKLIYGSDRDSCGRIMAIAFPDFTAGKQVNVEWTWDMRKSGGEPPGSNTWWQWEVKDVNGNTTLTERQNITWLDDIHKWQTLSQGNIRLHYYAGGSSFGNTLKTTAVNALARLSAETGIKTEKTIHLYIYANNSDMRDAVLYEPGWTGGLAFPEYQIVIIGIAPEELEWGKRTVAHELTHVLVGDYTFSCLGAMPTWLVEGLAVYGEGGADIAAQRSFDASVRTDSLLSFQVLSGGFSEDPGKADLSYSQSFNMVNYLIEQYGTEKLLMFLQSLKSGGELNASLKDAYGFDLPGFENEWRTSFGLKAVAGDIIAATATPTIVPTFVPFEGVTHSISAQPSPTSMEIAGTPTPETASPFRLDSVIKDPTLNKAVTITLACVCGGLLIIVVVVIIIAVRQSKKKVEKDQGGAL